MQTIHKAPKKVVTCLFGNCSSASHGSKKIKELMNYNRSHTHNDECTRTSSILSALRAVEAWTENTPKVCVVSLDFTDQTFVKHTNKGLYQLLVVETAGAIVRLFMPFTYTHALLLMQCLCGFWPRTDESPSLWESRGLDRRTQPWKCLYTFSNPWSHSELVNNFPIRVRTLLWQFERLVIAKFKDTLCVLQ